MKEHEQIEAFRKFDLYILEKIEEFYRVNKDITDEYMFQITCSGLTRIIIDISRSLGLTKNQVISTIYQAVTFVYDQEPVLKKYPKNHETN